MPFGSGARLLGNAPAIDATMQRSRFGDTTSPLSQVSFASPHGVSQGNVLPMPPSQIPMSPVNVPQGQSQPKTPQSESEMIVRALVGRLKSLGQAPSPTQF